ncbi:GNAT family N-acetyltransferase [Puerhibacterium puerhi]|uniref:GNAT family N-acetyltransferase n=1 Tax=Puerhibacterium puerhi TaxID=2692623 RepID=UPI001F48FC40|nr:GNAT family N-acetyltransferase [Puerhibacterium puerhi]
MTVPADLVVAPEPPDHPDVVALLSEHLADMYATTPAESVHALDVRALLDPAITFVTARDAGGALLGCGALKELDAGHGELKSMRTAASARGRGVATAVLRRLLAIATERGYARVSLETGTQEFFAPARRLYARHGFTECPPFAGYGPDPHSAFMTLALPVSASA